MRDRYYGGSDWRRRRRWRRATNADLSRACLPKHRNSDAIRCTVCPPMRSSKLQSPNAHYPRALDSPRYRRARDSARHPRTLDNARHPRARDNLHHDEADNNVLYWFLTFLSR